MKNWKRPIGFIILSLIGPIATFFIVDFYVQRTASDLVATFLEAESGNIQQGNLLQAVTKFQAAIDVSESLSGVGLYNEEMDPSFAYPLIKLGTLPTDKKALENFRKDFYKTGLFSRILSKNLGNKNYLVFYFQPYYVLWSYLLFAVVLFLFSLFLALHGVRTERIRNQERAEILNSVWRQISHDIKSPISAIQIFAHSLAKEGREVGLLLDVIQRVESIVDDLKLRSENVSDLFSATDVFRLDEVIDKILNEKKLAHSNLKFVGDVSGPIRVRGSKSQFERMISNILNNSIEASETGGQIYIMVNESKSNTCIIKVRDHGRGMSPQQVGLLFKSPVSFAKKGGQGLGLTHAKKVVDSVKGTIKVESELNKGLEVSLEIPTC